MNVVLVVIALTFCCSALLAVGFLGEHHEGFARWCDDLFPDTTHRGRL
jgi:hypothetical protein